MSETIADRIQQRLDALGLSERAASLAATGSDATIRMIRTGKSQNPRSDTVLKLAEVLQTTPQWLVAGADGQAELPAPAPAAPASPPAREFEVTDQRFPSPATMDKDLPVWGSAMGSLIDGRFEGFHVFTGEPVDRVRRPPALVGVRDAYGIYVSGESMDPMHPHGALRMVHPHRPIHPGDTVVVVTRHWDSDPGQGYIKILRRRTGDRLILEQLNPKAMLEVPVKYVASVHKVLDMNDLFGV